MTLPKLVAVGRGRIGLGHRPKVRALAELKTEGCTHILTLLSEREGARSLGAAATSAGLSWIWFPLEGGAPLPPERDEEIRDLFVRVAKLLDDAAGVYVHCSAGIHRTGMVGYALLRHLGLSEVEAMERLREMRDLTAEGVGDERLAWGDRFARAVTRP